MSFKKNILLGVANEIAIEFLEKTKEFYKRAEIAGSIRRKEPIVHDIDFAVIPATEDHEMWKKQITDRVNQIGGKVISFGNLICNIHYKEVQVNLFIGNGDVWGVTLMWATGPKGHTIGMTIKAQKKGLLYNSTGIWTRDDPPKLMGAKTEEEIANLLDWEYKPPELRGKKVSGETGGGELFY